MFYGREMFNVLLFYPLNNNVAVREVTTLALRVFYVLSFESCFMEERDVFNILLFYHLNNVAVRVF